MTLRMGRLYLGCCLILAGLALAGCDKTESDKPRDPDLASNNATPAKPAASPEVAGQWKAQMGDPAAFSSTMQLDLRADGTAHLTNTMTRSAAPGQTITNKAEGRWSAQGNQVTLELERSPDGRQIPQDERHLVFTYSPADKTLAGPDGPTFKRVE